jgi:hypothetical protein
MNRLIIKSKQICPMCNGKKIIENKESTAIYKTCDICNGSGLVDNEIVFESDNEYRYPCYPYYPTYSIITYNQRLNTLPNCFYYQIINQ